MTWAELRLAAMFLTRLPVGRIGDPPPLSAALWAFPVVGIVVGAAAWAAWATVGGPAGAVLAVLAAAMVTGGLHLDGLADMADGFGGGRDRARVLEIMRDSRVGSYGVLAIAFAVALPAAAIWQADAGLGAFLFLGVASRLMMLVTIRGVPSAREDGLGQSVGAGGAIWPGALLAAVLILWLGGPALLALVAMLILRWWLARLAVRRIGGQTGDVLGATQAITEAAGWAVLAALA